MKKYAKRILIISLILVALVFLLRGGIYRNLVKYQSIGQREDYYYKNGYLVARILRSPENKDSMNFDDIVDAALKITSKSLQFTTNSCEIDPNRLIETLQTNCVGYSAFYSTACNLLLYKHGLSENWHATSQVGHLFLFGFNIHKSTNNPFFKDHDFVIIKNKITGELLSVDPTIHDYLEIKTVTLKTE
ncbi:MAG: hypothetical protein ABJB16_18715 [Saprospiraceae bacterium]